VLDPEGHAVAYATVAIVNSATGATRSAVTDSSGRFVIQILPPGDYSARAEIQGLSPQVTPQLHVDIGGSVELQFRLSMAGASETVTVSGAPPLVETVPSSVSTVVDERAINELPLNGRRFTDLSLLAPGVTQDPRGLTSTSNGDLAFGGIRGYQSSYLVDGADNNNAFFSQARGRYRAPYQFSNEVVQEFRVSSNTYGAELGRAGGAVVNVVTKSGSNPFHGTGFYFIRNSMFGAQPAFLDFKPSNRQHQFGGTIGGLIRSNRIFFFAGYDQHIFHVPTVVNFASGGSVLVPASRQRPSPGRGLRRKRQSAGFRRRRSTQQAGRELSRRLAGQHRLVQGRCNPHGAPPSFRAPLNTSRYYGTNNVFFDPTSPVTNSALSDNGEENVTTESASVTLTSALSTRLVSHLRAQFSRDLQSSSANSPDPRTHITNVLDGIGQSTILPRETPSTPGRSNPALWAQAHSAPRVCASGAALLHPEFRQRRLPSRHQRVRRLRAGYPSPQGPSRRQPGCPLRPADLLDERPRHQPALADVGQGPGQGPQFSPRVGLAYSIGQGRPLVIRAGYGLFYTRIPQIYTSTLATDNGMTSANLILDNTNYYEHQVFPAYPGPLASCAMKSTFCAPPSTVSSYLSSDVAAFAPNFVTPRVHQASLNLEREIANRFAGGVSYMYVHGQNLIRARDVNLPTPTDVTYPVYDESDVNFLGAYYDVPSFSTGQMTRSMTCPFPPCINPLARPISQLGAINQFDSAASSVYQGLTVSLHRRMTSGLYFRMAYTFAHAYDDGQDALVSGRPVTVQNSYSTSSERGPSATDQRHRFVLSAIEQPTPFGRDHALLSKIFNDWKIAGVLTIGSGRPVDAKVFGDPNQDGNTYNDRLPGYGRNAFLGPDYATTDLRLTRRFYLRPRLKLELVAEAFNALNRDNRRVTITDDGFTSTATDFVQLDKTIGISYFPAYYQRPANLARATSAYAPRQIQFAVKLIF
jgi:hypothetical protein